MLSASNEIQIAVRVVQFAQSSLEIHSLMWFAAGVPHSFFRSTKLRSAVSVAAATVAGVGVPAQCDQTGCASLSMVMTGRRILCLHLCLGRALRCSFHLTLIVQLHRLSALLVCYKHGSSSVCDVRFQDWAVSRQGQATTPCHYILVIIRLMDAADIVWKCDTLSFRLYFPWCVESFRCMKKCEQ